MEPVEIILILIGVAFVISSYFVQEKLSQKEVEQIADLSEKELQILVEKQVKIARGQIENAVEDAFDEALEITRRGLEKTTNDKIMAVSEYSDTILESMNKTHNEIMFLYSMLNDKHAELTELAGSIQQVSKKARKTKAEKLHQPEELVVEKEIEDTKEVVEISTEEVKSVATPKTRKRAKKKAEPEVSAHVNKNEQILALHKEGKSNVEIAKILDCGLGEVKLVLGLFKEE